MGEKGRSDLSTREGRVEDGVLSDGSCLLGLLLPPPPVPSTRPPAGSPVCRRQTNYDTFD